MLSSLFESFDNIIVLDTETTGFDPVKEEIIELAMFIVSRDGAVKEYDKFIELSPGRSIPEKIVELTGITDDMLLHEGYDKESVCLELAEALSLPRPLVVAYNAQFDMNFIFHFLRRFGKAEVLRNIKMLDALTVYKDRRPYPHKLCNAIEQYRLDAQNTHRAIDDTKATFELLRAMDEELGDLPRYINLFGYNPKFGVSGRRIGSVTYRPQGYQSNGKLYDTPLF